MNLFYATSVNLQDANLKHFFNAFKLSVWMQKSIQ